MDNATLTILLIISLLYIIYLHAKPQQSRIITAPPIIKTEWEEEVDKFKDYMNRLGSTEEETEVLLKFYKTYDTLRVANMQLGESLAKFAL